MSGQVPKKVVNLGGKIEGVIKDLDKVRGEIAVIKMRLAQAEEQERELLRQILGLCTDEEGDVANLWLKPGNFETAVMIGPDAAVVEIVEDWWELPMERRHESVSVKFVPCVPQGL